KVAEASFDFEQHYPKPGWVEHDLAQVWESVEKAIRKVTESIDAKKIIAVGITNQRETLCFWEKGTAKPYCRAIVWQDRRTAEMCDQMKSKGTERFFQENTGLLLDPYFSGTKAAWAFKHFPEIKAAHKDGRLAAGTMDSFIIAKLTGGTAHVTEPSNASRTLCYHLTRHKWDSELCAALSVPVDIWPEVRPSMGTFALTRGVGFLPDGIPITGVLGDQQAALLGQACVKEGAAKCTYGTGAFLLLNTGSKPIRSRHRLLSTIAWALNDSDYTYALEGSAFIAGAAVQWLRDGLGFIKSAEEIEALARTETSSQGVVFVPALTGLGAPYWDHHATGMFPGLTRGTNRGHMARAVLEGIVNQNADILLAMQKDLGKPLTSLNVDGGASANDLLMQCQADILGVPLRRPEFLETTALGAVFAAGIGAGVWKNLSDIEVTWKEDRSFVSHMTDKQREEALAAWHLAIKRVTLTAK
ncbi:MAG: glycerol kinase GlpK, partial [Bdellovibrionota bacterium]